MGYEHHNFLDGADWFSKDTRRQAMRAALDAAISVERQIKDQPETQPIYTEETIAKMRDFLFLKAGDKKRKFSDELARQHSLTVSGWTAHFLRIAFSDESYICRATCKALAHDMVEDFGATFLQLFRITHDPAFVSSTAKVTTPKLDILAKMYLDTTQKLLPNVNEKSNFAGLLGALKTGNRALYQHVKSVLKITNKLSNGRDYGIDDKVMKMNDGIDCLNSHVNDIAGGRIAVKESDEVLSPPCWDRKSPAIFSTADFKRILNDRDVVQRALMEGLRIQCKKLAENNPDPTLYHAEKFTEMCDAVENYYNEVRAALVEMVEKSVKTTVAQEAKAAHVTQYKTTAHVRSNGTARATAKLRPSRPSRQVARMTARKHAA